MLCNKIPKFFWINSIMLQQYPAFSTDIRKSHQVMLRIVWVITLETSTSEACNFKQHNMHVYNSFSVVMMKLNCIATRTQYAPVQTSAHKLLSFFTEAKNSHNTLPITTTFSFCLICHFLELPQVRPVPRTVGADLFAGLTSYCPTNSIKALK